MATSVRSSIKVTQSSQSEQGFVPRLEEASPIEVFPPEIVFKDIETEQIYEVTVCVRNLSRLSRRIRFTPPKTVRFKAQYEHLGALAVGIAVNVIISFETDQLGDYHDEMTIHSEDFTYILPLHAYKPSPDILFEPFLSLGFTAVAKSITQTAYFQNRGSVKGEVRIKYDKQLASELSVTPETFTVDPGASSPVSISYLSRDANNFRCELIVEVEGRVMPGRISVTASCVEQQIALVASQLKEISHSEDQESLAVITSLDFDTMYHGQKKDRVAYLVNVGPFPVKYNVKFLPGTEDIMETENYLLMTPQEVATQSIKRVIDASPASGEIPAFSQVPVKFSCNSKFRDSSKGFVHNIMEEKLHMSEEEAKDMEAMYFYTALFTFSDSEQKLKLQLQARAIYPNIRISHTSVHFNECPVNDRRDFEITIENLNSDLPLDFHITKLAYFMASPKLGQLKPAQVRSIVLTFKPANLGNYEGTLMLTFLKGSYQVPLTLYGSSGSIGKRIRERRGLETTEEDFKLKRNFVSLENLAHSTQVKPSLWRDDRDLSPPIDEAITLRKKNKQRYNAYLRESRSQRLFTLNKSKKVAMSQTLPRTLEEIEKNTDFCLSSAAPRTKALQLPTPQAGLYVEKPLGKYEASHAKNQEYSHDPNKPVRNAFKRTTEDGKFEEMLFSEKPIRQLEMKECFYALTPFDLKLISAGPKRIDYGEVVIRCEVSKWFTVVNDLKQNIFVELIPDIEEVHQIDPMSLVIPPGQKGGFRIALMSTKKQRIASIIKYIINTKYEFNFMIIAEVLPAVLELSVPGAPEFSLNLPYLFFRFEENSMLESVIREVIIMNKCTAQTKFTWVLPAESNYVVEPMEEVVESMKQMKAVVKFTPGVSPKKNEEENLVMKVENGDSQSIICKGEVSDSNCVFMQKNLDFGTVAVGLKHERSLTIRNLKPKATIFYIRKCPPELEVTPVRGKIGGDAKFPLKVVFCSMVEVDYTAELEIIVRGGRNVLILPVQCRVLEPLVSIEEDEIDFGGVTVGSHLTRTVTIENDSEIPAIMYLNLEEHSEFSVSVQTAEGDVDTSVLISATGDKDCPFYVKEEDEDLDDPRPDPLMDEDELEEDDEEEEEPRKFKITVLPEKTAVLLLKFSPKETEPSHFSLPIVLAGVNQTTNGLQRTVTGEGLKPRFYVESSIIDFKKKVITPGEKTFSVYKTFLVSNPEVYMVRWRIDCSGIDQSQFFSIKPAEGTIEPGGFLNIRAGFNPLQPIPYEDHVNLYLDDSTDPYLAFTLQGEGTTPRIYFDRREVVMPVVPLGIQARSVFHIVNDGYENVELGFEIREDPGNINLKLVFLDGKQLGITKPKLALEATFMSNKPLSFSNIVEFFDQDRTKYPITISGTADNSLLTTYSFIQRNPDEVRLDVDDRGCVTLIQEAQSDAEVFSDKGGNVSRTGPRTTAGSSVVSQGVRSILGYNPVPQPMLERSLDFLARWLNHVVLNNPVNKLPDDFIASNGTQLYEIITVLSGKTPPGQVRITGVPVKDHMRLLMKQYTELLGWLKAGGALLNTIRPEFLLSMADYGRYLKMTPDMLQLRPRQIERRWPYFSMDSWITLLYQIIKLYVLAQVTPKVFKSLPGITPEKSIVDEAMASSNIYSLSECILLRWLSLHFSNVYPMTSRKVFNFDQDLLDGTVISAVVQSHMGAIGQLSKVKFNPLNDDQRKGNIEKVISALNDSGMPTFLTLRDLIGSFISPREMVLFCITLFQGLPHYIPKCSIEFPCVLGDKVVRHLELTNPSNKSVTYWVRLEGSSDFQLQNNEDFVIAPHASEDFQVIFQSRIFAPVTGRLRLTNRGGEGGAHAAALVFNLVSKVLSRRSEKLIDLESHLYEAIIKDVEVVNRFTKDAEFSVQLVQVIKESPPAQPTEKGKKPIKVKPFVVFPNPFSLKIEKFKVKKGATTSIPIVFQPFEMDTQEANLIFIDENVGEMQYTLKGKVTPPRVDRADKLEFKRELGATIPVEVPICAKNRLFERAKADALSRVAGVSKAKEREVLREVFSNLFEEVSVFEVVINSPFFSGPTNFTITDISRGKLDVSQISNLESSHRAGEMGDSRFLTTKQPKNPSRAQSVATAADKTTTMNLGFAPKQPGEYTCQITMTNRLKTDIRAYDLAISVLPRKTQILFEMITQARVTVTQEIPIVNPGDKDWNVKVRLTQDGDQFSVTRDFQVRKRNTGHCIITFKPEWVCDVNARLELEVVATNEIHEFTVHGKATEPRAEDHVIIPCRVKERSVHKVAVPNPKPYTVSYKVISDLRNATGDSVVDVAANSTGSYEIVMYPLQSGTYTGSLTFMDYQGHFYWYTLEVRSASPEPEAVKELRVQCRRAVELKITVFNPLPEDTVFDVNLTGDGLFGDAQFTIPAKMTEVYTVLYSPLSPGQSDGSIFFLSEKTGEFWYKMRLICDPADPVDLEAFECDIGRSVAKPISLENPSSQEAVLEYVCSNPVNFELIPDTIIIPPYGALEVLVKYSPTSIRALEVAQITLTSKLIGDWIFNTKGLGLPPSPYDPTIVTAGIGDSTSVQVPFRNPFRDTVSVSVWMETDSPEIFIMLLKKSKFTVAPMSLLMIPVAFKPVNMEERGAKVMISAAKDLIWVFPLRGITEKPSYKIDFTFKAKCRTKLQKEIEIRLPDLPELVEDENFTHELKISNPESATLALKSFSIEPLKNILLDQNDVLKYEVMFEPLRPFKTDAELLIYKATGGRWRFNVVIEAKEPDMDDTILIESPMGKPASVAFKLSNHFKQYASFEAFFKTDSDSCFSVKPQKGVLEPFGREGTQFVVTFSPSEYGFPKAGKLVIRTEEMQWTYLVKGTHPAYEPPVGRTLVDDRLTKTQRSLVNMAQHLTKKNYIRENIQTHSLSPKRNPAPQGS